ncbi:MAG: cupin domain-containing protein [Deltaproteobacteria bacterium]|jgi:transcriptional regulator with XRE-family HTH domain
MLKEQLTMFYSVSPKTPSRRSRQRESDHLSEDDESPEFGQPCEIQVGQQIRSIRVRRGLSIRALADMSDLSPNTLSLIERGKTSPSVNTLQQIAHSLQLPITAFFESRNSDIRVVHQKAGLRPGIVLKHGIMKDLGVGMPRLGAEPLIITLESKADSGQTPIVHTGREFVYCLEGHILYTIENEEFELSPGDSLLFDAYLPHRWKNTDNTPSRALIVLCPLDNRDNPIERHFNK